MAAPRLEVRGVAKAFAGVPALRGVDLEVAPGEVHALLGANGAGKSTLIKIVAGAQPPDAGEIRIDGERASLRSPRDAQARGVFVIYQELALVPDLTVAENLFLGREPRRGLFVDRRAMERAARDVLGGDLGLEVDPRAPVRTLSAGERQGVEIARALLADARLVALDEPTTSLSEAETERLFAAVRRLKARGCSFLYVSHRLDEIPRIADRVTMLRDGERVLAGESAATLERARIVELLAGRPARPDQAATAADGAAVGGAGGPLLVARGVRPRGQRHAWSFEVRPGEILGLFGLVGAGRSTLARLLAGAEPLEAGELLLGGQPLRLGSPADALDRGIVLLPEERRAQGIFAELSVRANASVSGLRALSTLGLVRHADERAAVAELARDLRVKAASLEQAIGTLSGGNQQKVLLARALLARARVLVIDEPTRGIDVGARAEIHDLLRRLAARGLCVVAVSSDEDEVRALAHRVLVLARGRIRGELSQKEATRERLLALALEHEGVTA